MEGDKRTPEGQFKVLLKKIHPKWGPELLLDFPNPSTMKKFQERKGQGLVPKTARPGSGIAIHATRPEEEWTVDYYQNWTDGCVSLKYSEAKDLYSYIRSLFPQLLRREGSSFPHEKLFCFGKFFRVLGKLQCFNKLLDISI